MNKKMKMWMLAGAVAVVAGSGTAMAAGTNKPAVATTAAQTNGTATDAQGATKHHKMEMPFLGKDNTELQQLLKLDAAALKQKVAAGKSLLDIATEQGVTKDQLVAALTKQHETMMAQQVKDGRLTQAQADAMKTRVPDMVQKMIERKGGQDEAGHKGGEFHMMGNDQGLLDLLKVTQAELKTSLDQGKTVLDVAQAKGVSKQQVVDYVLKQHQTQIDQALKGGKITDAQAKQEKDELTAAKVEQMLSNKGLQKHHGEDKQDAQDPADAQDGQDAQVSQNAQVQQN